MAAAERRAAWAEEPVRIAEAEQVMPNWSKNRLVITGEEVEIVKVRSALEGSRGLERLPIDLEKLVPSPANKKAEALLEWRGENWGTSANIQPEDVIREEEAGHSWLVEFYSAWSPPVEFLESVANRPPFDQVILELTYYEPLAVFAGWLRLDCGTKTDEAFVDSDLTALLEVLRKHWPEEARAYESEAKGVVRAKELE